MRTLLPFFVVAAVGCSAETKAPTPETVEAVAAKVEASAQAAKAESPKPIDLTVGDGYEMRGIIKDGRLAVVPIVATGDIAQEPTLTLDAGMRQRKVIVREVRGEWDVGMVRVTNKSRMPLLVLRGEIIVGARQDRAIGETRVIMAGTTEEVPVYCVEQDRSNGSKTFKSANAMAELDLRRTVAHKDQNAVWAQVAKINDRLGIHADTSTYRHAAARNAQGENLERAQRIAAQLAQHPDAAKIVGVAVAINGEVLAIDRFASPAVFQSLQGKLLSSYVASDFEGVIEGRRLTPEAVRALAALPSATSSTDASYSALRPIN